MASIRVYLKKSSTQKNSGNLIVFIIFDRDNIVRYPTGKKCLIKDWNKVSQRARPCKDQAEINERIENLVAKITDILGIWQREGKDPDMELLHRKLEQFDGKRIASGPELTFLECVLHQSDLLEERGSESYRQFNALAAQVKRFEKTYGKVFVEKIDMEFLQNWIQFLQISKFGRDGKSYTKNYIWNSVQMIKGVLYRAKDRGEQVNPIVFSHQFKAPSEEAFNIYLNKSKLEKIANCRLQARYVTTRDLFIIQAYTGLRYSDISTISMSNIKDGCLTKVQVKTGGKVSIPLHPLVLDIIKLYEGKLPKAKSNNGMNQDLKVIGEAAGLTEIISKTRVEGGKRVTREFPEHDLIFTHTGRRSFCTNSYLDGVPILSIMSLSGHKTIASFMKYIKIGEKELTDSLKGHPFFSR